MVDSSLFHFSLIKMLIVEEMQKKKQLWLDFLISSKFTLPSARSPSGHKGTPSTTKTTSSPLKSLNKENMLASVELSPKKKGRKLQFSQEVVQILVPRRPLTKGGAKRFPLDKLGEEFVESQGIKKYASSTNEIDKPTKESKAVKGSSNGQNKTTTGEQTFEEDYPRKHSSN